ncbi:hypothetical protein BJY00DRAFT_284640 [Aspergillus carlsbadensis]|nr:hypothetical protein BJY00DRAFT_284640 [Aspergillus carlsbadensis]
MAVDHAGVVVSLLAVYAEAGVTLAAKLMEVSTRQGYEESLKYFKKVLRTLRFGPHYDPFNMHEAIAGVLFQLGRDQDCYEFMRAWAMAHMHGSDFAQMTLALTNIESADIFEAIDVAWNRTNNIMPLVFLTLLKLKLLLDLKALEITTEVIGPKVPREILDSIRPHVPASSAITEAPELLRRDDHTADINTLSQQARSLYKRLLERRDRLEHLLNKNCADAPDGSHVGLERSAASAVEAEGGCTYIEQTVNYSYNCWKGIPGAEDFIRDLEAEIHRSGELSHMVGIEGPQI